MSFGAHRPRCPNTVVDDAGNVFRCKHRRGHGHRQSCAYELVAQPELEHLAEDLEGMTIYDFNREWGAWTAV